MTDTLESAGVRQPKVFVCYSRADTGIAQQFRRLIQDRGCQPVIDVEDLDAGERWKDRLRKLIVAADSVVYILTASSAASSYCRWELAVATGSNKKIIVVVPAALGDGVEAPPNVGKLHRIFFYSDPTVANSGFFDGPEKLERALKTDLAAQQLQADLHVRAERWQARGRPDDDLLRGGSLEEALQWLESLPEDAAPDIIDEFITASEEHEENNVIQEEDVRKLRGAVIGTSKENRALKKRLRAAEEKLKAGAPSSPAGTSRPPPNDERQRAPHVEPAPQRRARSPLDPLSGPQSWPEPQPQSRGDEFEPSEMAPRRAPQEIARAGRSSSGLGVVLVILVVAGVAYAGWQYLLPHGAALAEDPPVADPPFSSEPESGQAQIDKPPVETPRPAPAGEPAPPEERTQAANPAPAAAPAPAAKTTTEAEDWEAARTKGTLLALRDYVAKRPSGAHRTQAIQQARRRITALSVKPASRAVILSGPVTFREAPTLDIGGSAMGSAGMEVNIIDKISTKTDGGWLVFERRGAWPFRFVATDEVKGQ